MPITMRMTVNPSLGTGMFYSAVMFFLGDFTVAFLGTSDGHLKKTVVESASSGIEYADIPIAPGIYLEKKLLLLLLFLKR